MLFGPNPAGGPGGPGDWLNTLLGRVPWAIVGVVVAMVVIPTITFLLGQTAHGIQDGVTGLARDITRPSSMSKEGIINLCLWLIAGVLILRYLLGGRRS